jgi:hypothetical protein
MMIATIEGVTHRIGKSQGYLGLPLRFAQIDCPVNGPGTPTMTTAWQPTPQELAALNRGASIHVRIIGMQHPPIMLFVGPEPEDLEVIL